MPDHYAAYQQAASSCTSQGGTMHADQCVIPVIQSNTIAVTTAAPSGNCASWLAAAGVSDVANAMKVIDHESGCNPYAQEKHTGACNVAQELPCGKSGCALGDGACDVKWMANVYIPQRYGTWAAAEAHELAYGWY